MVIDQDRGWRGFVISEGEDVEKQELIEAIRDYVIGNSSVLIMYPEGADFEALPKMEPSVTFGEEQGDELLRMIDQMRAGEI